MPERLACSRIARLGHKVTRTYRRRVWAWVVGWTVALGGAAGAGMLYDWGVPGEVAGTLGGVSGFVGISLGAYRSTRLSGDAGSRRALFQVLAWGLAFAYGSMFVIWWSPSKTALADRYLISWTRYPEELVRWGVACLAVAAVGGFLSTAASARWHLTFKVAWRGFLASVGWTVILSGCAVTGAMVFSLLWNFVATLPGMGLVGVSVIAGGLTSLTTGLLLGVGAEALSELARDAGPPY